MGKVIGAVLALFGLACGLALAINLSLLFAPHDAKYTGWLVGLAVLSVCALWACLRNALRAWTGSGHPADVISGLAAGLLGLLILYLYANMGH